jgi:hypothetical protein
MIIILLIFLTVIVSGVLVYNFILKSTESSTLAPTSSTSRISTLALTSSTNRITNTLSDDKGDLISKL